MEIKGSIAALVTPFDFKNRVDYDGIRKLVRWHKSQGTDGLVVLGTTGEKPTLTPGEQRKVLEIVCEEGEKEILIIAGTGTNNTEESIQSTKLAQSIGADAALIIVPYYNKPGQRGCLLHFQEIARNTRFPLIAYHHPGRTGQQLTEETLLEILNISEIAGIKECSGDLALVKKLKEKSEKSIFCGDDVLLYEFMRLGAKGCISVIANLFPKQWSDITKSFLFDYSENKKVEFQKLLPLLYAVHEETNPVGIKYAMSLAGICHPFLRLPLTEASINTKNKIQEAFDALKPNLCRKDLIHSDFSK